MAIRQIKKEPELPPSHLYLEDIEELVEAMVEFDKKKEARLTDVPMRFVLGNSECDSLDDLKKLKRKTYEFSMNVGLSRFAVLKTGVYCSDGILDKAMQLMEARESKVRALLLEVPFWAIIAWSAVWGLLVGIRFKYSAYWLIGPCLLVFPFWADFHHTAVDLRYSYEPSPKRQKLKEWGEKALWIVLGVFLAGAAQWLWHYLTKH